MTEDISETQPLISVRDLKFRYPQSQHDVLRMPFLDVPARGMTAITGPSGAGKSTLIELLAGTLREPYDGSVKVLGIEWKTLTRDADRQRQLRRVGLIPQDFGLLPGRTPAQLLDQELADAGIPHDQRAERIQDALATINLTSEADRAISGLSGGQRQRVAIARMLARKVELVIADEPTANLDPVLTAEVMTEFRRLAQQVPVVIITHHPSIARACDQTIVLQSAVDGSLHESEPAARPRRRRILAIAGIAAGLIAIAAFLAVSGTQASGGTPQAGKGAALRPTRLPAHGSTTGTPKPVQAHSPAPPSLSAPGPASVESRSPAPTVQPTKPTKRHTVLPSPVPTPKPSPTDPNPPPSTDPGQAPLPSGAVKLGSVDLEAYCQGTYGLHAALRYPVTWGWRCGRNPNGAWRPGDKNIDVTEACYQQYSTGTIAHYTHYDNPYSWVCWQP